MGGTLAGSLELFWSNPKTSQKRRSFLGTENKGLQHKTVAETVQGQTNINLPTCLRERAGRKKKKEMKIRGSKKGTEVGTNQTWVSLYEKRYDRQKGKSCGLHAGGKLRVQNSIVPNVLD